MYSKEYYRDAELFNSSHENCNFNSVNVSCNITLSYDDLKLGTIKDFYVHLNITQPMNNMMCQAYNPPLIIKSMKSSIDVTKIVGELPYLDSYTCTITCYTYVCTYILA